MVFNVCVLLEFVERLYAKIDGYNMCVLLELSDSLCVRVVTTCVCVCSYRNVCFTANLWFAAETESSIVNKHSLPNCVFCSEIIRYWNYVVCSELAFAANNMSSANLWLAAEVELSAANLWFVAKTELPAVNKHSLPNRVFCNEFVIRCWSWVVCSESVIRYRNCVVYSELVFIVEWCVL
jgi:hypothetical protein